PQAAEKNTTAQRTNGPKRWAAEAIFEYGSFCLMGILPGRLVPRPGISRDQYGTKKGARSQERTPSQRPRQASALAGRSRNGDYGQAAGEQTVTPPVQCCLPVDGSVWQLGGSHCTQPFVCRAGPGCQPGQKFVLPETRVS